MTGLFGIVGKFRRELAGVLSLEVRLQHATQTIETMKGVCHELIERYNATVERVEQLERELAEARAALAAVRSPAEELVRQLLELNDLTLSWADQDHERLQVAFYYKGVMFDANGLTLFEALERLPLVIKRDFEAKLKAGYEEIAKHFSDC